MVPFSISLAKIRELLLLLAIVVVLLQVAQYLGEEPLLLTSFLIEDTVSL